MKKKWIFLFLLFLEQSSYATLPTDECHRHELTDTPLLPGLTTTCGLIKDFPREGEMDAEIIEVPIIPNHLEINTAVPLIPHFGPDFLSNSEFQKVGQDFKSAFSALKTDVRDQRAQDLFSGLHGRVENILMVHPRLSHFMPETDEGSERSHLIVHCSDPLYRYQSFDEGKDIFGKAPNLHTDYAPSMYYPEIKWRFLYLFPPELQSDEYELLKTVNVWMLLSERQGAFPLGFVHPSFLFGLAPAPASASASASAAGEDPLFTTISKQVEYGTVKLSYDPRKGDDSFSEDEGGAGPSGASQTSPLCRIRSLEEDVTLTRGKSVPFLSGALHLTRALKKSFKFPMFYSQNMGMFGVAVFDSKYIVHGPINNRRSHEDRESIEFRCFYFQKKK